MITFLSELLAPCSPAEPANGYMLGRNLQHQSRIYFGCNKGFILRGSSFSQCIDGRWDSPVPVCEGNITSVISNIMRQLEAREPTI